MQIEPAQAGDVPALRKGLTVLELLASDGPLTLSEIQHRGALNKTMTFRLVRVLRQTGYVDHDPDRRRYSLALKLLKLCGAVAARHDLVAAVQPHLDRLRVEFGETTNLGVIDDGHVVYVAMAESSRSGLRMASHVGGRGCLHSTAMGKAMLAFLPEREALLANLAMTAVTPKTITNLDELRAELDRTRGRGYAIDNEENEIGAHCIGAPILDGAGRPLAAISISGPAARIRSDALDAMAERLWAVSREISARFGHDVSTSRLDSRELRRAGEA